MLILNAILALGLNEGDPWGIQLDHHPNSDGKIEPTLYRGPRDDPSIANLFYNLVAILSQGPMGLSVLATL